MGSPDPRLDQHGNLDIRLKRFLTELRRVIDQLQNDGHAILIMFDANGTLEQDKKLQDL